MKIVQLFKIYWPDNGGGIAKVMEGIADGFPDCDQEIIVCQSDRHKRSIVDSYKGVRVYRCRQLFDLASTPISPFFLHEVKKHTRNADIVVYHFPYPMVDLAVLLGMYSGRLIVWWHCGLEKYKKLVPFYRPLVEHTLEKAERILVSSRGNIENSDILLKYRKKCRVIPFCVSDECLQRGRRHAKVFYENKDQQKRKVNILFIGRLVWYKGCDILLKAFALMQNKDCRLVLVGGGPLEKDLKKLAVSLKLKHVEFAGMVSEEEKMKRLVECDFLVLPSVSRAEAFAVVQLEAMAFGKPVINTKLKSGVPHVSIDRVSGRTVKPGSVRKLAEAMEELAGDEGLRRKYGRNALRVVQGYTQEMMVERHREVFWQVAAEHTERMEIKK